MKSAFAGWPEIRGRVRAAGTLALFLDYDGTLTPIVSHPSKAPLPQESRALLRDLSRQPGVWVAVVSGRALKEIRKRVGLKKVCYVGNHGLEIQGPGLRHVNPMARKSRPILKKIAASLRRELKKIPGAWVEDKGLTLTAHFRQAAPAGKLLARGAFHGVVRPYRERKQVRVTAGKEVFEVRPPFHWTKGTVVSWLLARRSALSCGPVLPVYIGDDLTDEDAFLALGKRGVTVVVGRDNPFTRAQYRVLSPEEVQRFLRLLLSERGADRAGRGNQRGGKRHPPSRT